MRTIEIDLDIHKLIEAERKDFEEPPHAALRRLLKLPEITSATRTNERPSWTSEGARLPHGTKVRMTYGKPKTVYTGTISDGSWIIDGKAFDSPSAAASAVAVTKSGDKTRLNGWKLWKVQRPGETRWTPLDNFRRPNLEDLA